MTKREYLVSLGLAKPGRGRMSREAHAALAKAEAEGMTFDDPSPVIKPKVNTPKASKPVSAPKPSAPPSAGIIGEVIRFHDLDDKFTGEDSKGKKHTVNARQVCRKSGYSITSCPCGQEHEVLVPSMEFVTVTKKGR